MPYDVIPPLSPLPRPVAAGLPANNDFQFCDNTTRSCYFMVSTPRLAYAGAVAACAGRGGYLVSYNTAAEQLSVERYFRTTGEYCAWFHWQLLAQANQSCVTSQLVNSEVLSISGVLAV